MSEHHSINSTIIEGVRQGNPNKGLTPSNLYRGV